MEDQKDEAKKSLILPPLRWAVPQCRGSTYPICIDSHKTECPSLFSCDSMASTKTHYLAFAFPLSLPRFLFVLFSCYPGVTIPNTVSASACFPGPKLRNQFIILYLLGAQYSSRSFKYILTGFSKQFNDIRILSTVISVLQVRNWGKEILRIFHKVLQLVMTDLGFDAQMACLQRKGPMLYVQLHWSSSLFLWLNVQIVPIPLAKKAATYYPREYC